MQKKIESMDETLYQEISKYNPSECILSAELYRQHQYIQKPGNCCWL